MREILDITLILWSPKGHITYTDTQYICGIKSLWQVEIRKKKSKKAGCGEAVSKTEKQVTKLCSRLHITLISPSVGSIPSFCKSPLNLMLLYPCVQ